MEFFVNIIYVLAALGIIGLVLIQQGKGADMGASFGSGASQTIFGSVGSGNALTKATAWLALIFIICSLFLAVMARQRADQSIQDNSLIENVDQLQTIIQTAAPAQNADVNAVNNSDVPVVAGEAATIPDDELNQAIQAVIDTVQTAEQNLATEAEAANNAAGANADSLGDQVDNALEQVQQAADNQ